MSSDESMLPLLSLCIGLEELNGLELATPATLSGELEERRKENMRRRGQAYEKCRTYIETCKTAQPEFDRVMALNAELNRKVERVYVEEAEFDEKIDLLSERFKKLVKDDDEQTLLLTEGKITRVQHATLRKKLAEEFVEFFENLVDHCEVVKQRNDKLAEFYQQRGELSRDLHEKYQRNVKLYEEYTEIQRELVEAYRTAVEISNEFLEHAEANE